MKRRNAVIVIISGLALSACQSPEPASDETQKLEQRVAELEAALAEKNSGVPAEAEVARPTSTRPAPTPAAARPERPTPAPASRPVARPAEPEPMEELPAKAESEPATQDPFPATVDAEAEAPFVRELPAPQEIETEPVVPRPDPGPEPVEIPDGTELTLVLETPLSSVDSKPGDLVVAKVERAVDATGAIALPGATYVEGRVLEVRNSGRVKGRARVVAAFDRIILRGEPRRLETTPIVVEAESGAKRDAKIVAGATAAGAVLGAILGGKGGAGKGAILGGGAGAGAVLATKGKEVDLPSGSRWTVRVREGGSY